MVLIKHETLEHEVSEQTPDKFRKYGKPKPNKYTKKDFHKSPYIINQYQRLQPRK